MINMDLDYLIHFEATRHLYRVIYCGIKKRVHIAFSYVPGSFCHTIWRPLVGPIDTKVDVFACYPRASKYRRSMIASSYCTLSLSCLRYLPRYSCCTRITLHYQHTFACTPHPSTSILVYQRHCYFRHDSVQERWYKIDEAMHIEWGGPARKNVVPTLLTIWICRIRYKSNLLCYNATCFIWTIINLVR